MHSMEDERPAQPPEGKLIERAMKRTGRKSIRATAAEVPISEGRLRQIIHGYQTVRAGVHIPVSAPPETLATIAKAIGITPDELEAAGRADAAEELRELQAPEPDQMVAEPQNETYEDVMRRAQQKLAEANELLERGRQMRLGYLPEESPESMRKSG